jgi:hypothetical protein
MVQQQTTAPKSQEETAGEIEQGMSFSHGFRYSFSGLIFAGPGRVGRRSTEPASPKQNRRHPILEDDGGFVDRLENQT